MPASKANETGSGTSAVPSGGAKLDWPKLLARALKSRALTIPSPLKSPVSKARPLALKFFARIVKSSLFTVPSSVASPGRSVGGVIRRGLKKVAAYRDTDGKLHECTAVCPHLGGIVHWNHTEKTWDCPCHGSRFDPFGKVLNGPANTGLGPAE